MVVHIFRFADSINEDNIAETVTQCRLMRVADNEEWDDDFWDVRDDRLITLDAPDFVSGSLIFKKVILRPLDTEQCLGTVREFMDTYSPEKDIFTPTAETKDTICDIIRKSQLIELGDIYSTVRMWLSVSEDTVLTIEFGVYD